MKNRKSLHLADADQLAWQLQNIQLGTRPKATRDEAERCPGRSRKRLGTEPEATQDGAGKCPGRSRKQPGTEQDKNRKLFSHKKV